VARILVADDEEDLRQALARVVEQEGHEVLVAADGAEAVELAREHPPDLVVLDNRMPRLSGLEALARIRRAHPDVVAILFTAYDDAVDVRRAVLELGAYSYLTKGSGVEGIRSTIQQALRSRGLARERPAGAPPAAPEGDFSGLVGRSASMRALYTMITKIGHSDVTVLTQGESGTGKELVARAIHDRSLRAGRAYVTVDCGTLPDTLAESEIFGYEAGAFTDARRSRAGKLEMAHEGTLFLDEIGNLSPSAQAKLLRVLEDRRVTRLGGNVVKEVDVRIIAATNVLLDEASRHGTFREDLYYRLNVFTIHLPPLRERADDVALLVEHFLRRFCAEQRKSLPGGVTPEAMEQLRRHPWPGNVRELRNVLERAVLLAEGSVTTAELALGRTGASVASAPPPVASALAHDVVGAPPTGSGAPGGGEVDLDGVPLKEAKRLAGEAVERAYVLAALRRCRWNKRKAATLLGLNYKTLREKVKEHDLERLRWEP